MKVQTEYEKFIIDCAFSKAQKDVLRAFFSDYGSDRIDWLSIDRQDYDTFKGYLLDEYGIELPLTEKEVKFLAEIDKEKEQIDKKKELEKLTLDWNKNKVKLSKLKQFESLRELLRCFLSDSSKTTGFLLNGEGGTGKTKLTIEELEKQGLKRGLNYEIINGYCTPLALYERLCEFKDLKVIVLDDVEGLFSNPISVSLLKGGLWDIKGGIREVQYNSNTDKMSADRKFELKAKLIIICNDIPHINDLSMSALISRTQKYTLNFSYAEKLSMCETIINEHKEIDAGQKKYLIWLLNRYTNEATKDFNFRILVKAIDFIKYDKSKAKDLFIATTEKDEVLDLVIRLEKDTLYTSTSEKIKKFTEETGLGRRTYYRKRLLLCH